MCSENGMEAQEWRWVKRTYLCWLGLQGIQGLLDFMGWARAEPRAKPPGTDMGQG